MKNFLLILAFLTTINLSSQIQIRSVKVNTPQVLYHQNNYKEALDLGKKELLEQKQTGTKAVKLLDVAIKCLNRLRKQNELDDLFEKTVAEYSDSWRVLQAVALAYNSAPHYGYMIGNNFERGWHRRGGRYINSYDRDRIRAIQLYVQAMPLVLEHGTNTNKQDFFRCFAPFFRSNWQMQHLTDYTKLPEYSSVHNNYNRWSSSGAPVDADGNPVYYKLPASWDAAKNDGERWRWLLAEAKKFGYRKADLELAGFLFSQFGVQTMAYLAYRGDFSIPKTGPYSVHLLTDDETITRLATGIKRFKLPAEFNYIKIYKSLAETKDCGKQALNSLATIYTNRRQYDKAAACLQESLKKFPSGSSSRKRKLEQIVGHIGKFVQMKNPFAAGQKPKLRFLFRNARSVTFSLRKLKMELFLDDVDKYLKSDPDKLDWDKLNIFNLGNGIVRGKLAEYLDKTLAEWVEPLKPAPGHFDREKSVTVPVDKPGMYLLTAKFGDGNIARQMVWIADTAIVARNFRPNLYFVADAATGAPLQNVDLTFIGYRQEYLPAAKRKFNRRYKLHYDKFDGGKTDSSGFLKLNPDRLKRQYSYMVIARSASGRLALLPFRSWYSSTTNPQSYNRQRTYCITDRPVYRPGDTVHYKFWIRDVNYENDDIGKYGDKSVTVKVNSARGKEIYKKTEKSDRWGGLSGQFTIPEDADLGNWTVHLDGYNGYQRFRVEEYKKPEYEVTVKAPEKPIVLGQPFKVKIAAKYYFGAPVTNARVRYTVKRSEQRFNWFPPTPWDWLYGPGYWWCFPVYRWFDDIPFRCCIIWPPNYYTPPPELVCENETAIGADGTVEITVDTAFAKAMFGKTDHRYEITALVTDSSRRTIVGKKNVTAAAVPFRAAAWTSRGFYNTGDNVKINFTAITADRKGVPVMGDAKVYRLSYNKKGIPVEKEVGHWKVAAAADGQGHVDFTAPAPGQFRVVFKLTDAAKNTVSGDCVFNVYGEKLKPDDFRFNPLELIVDKKTYKPGEKVKLLINTGLNNSTVVLFVRPTQQASILPLVHRLDGKSWVYEFEIKKGDMPNCFVEAWTIADGKFYRTTRSISVPPEKRVVNVDIKPSKAKYLPGGDAKVKVRLTDIDGKPVTGSVVMSIYDKSVEYISGGSNIPEIKQFFWKWQRRYYSTPYTVLGIQFNNILKSGELYMQQLGVFGHLPDIHWEGAGRAAPEMMTLGSANRRMMAAPMPMMARKSKGVMAGSVMADGVAAESQQSSAALDEVHVRKEFADTAFWAGKLTPDKNGEVEISLKMPENLTTWKIRSWCMAAGTRVGQGETEVITSKDFLVRLQIPRFMVTGDNAVISGIVHNYLNTAQDVTARLQIGGKELLMTDKAVKIAVIKPKGEIRFDWHVKALNPGTASLTLAAKSSGGDDAMRLECPVEVHGILKQDAWCGTILNGDPKGNNAFVSVNLPEKRREAESKLQVNVSPSPALAIVDALPYLIGVNYKSTDATLNRFLPSIITYATLKKLNIKLPQIQDKTTNLNPTETGNPVKRAEQWKRWKENPVFDLKKLRKQVSRGIHTLKVMQLSDGGWGWFSGYSEHSTAYMTAYVIRGLMIAMENGVALDQNMINRGRQWLENHQRERLADIIKLERKKAKPWISNTDALVFLALVRASSASEEMSPMQQRLYQYREQLSPYGKALFALGLNPQKDREMFDMLLRNLEQYLKTDRETQTAYLDVPTRWSWWYWYASDTETQAAYLKLLCRAKVHLDRAAWIARFLIDNRKHATYWHSSRDTAFCVEALTDYLKVSGETEPEMQVEIRWDGKLKKEIKITPDNLFSFDNRLLMYGDALTGGRHAVQITRKGKGNLYFNVYLTYFTLEDFIKKSGLHVKINRNYYLLKRRIDKVLAEGARGQAVTIGSATYDRVPLPENANVKSGDLIEVEMIVESNNDYEYLLIEDMKPAGCEAAELRSGYTGNSLGAYVEYRDDRVCMYVQRLPRGKYSVTYRLKAEIPGHFSALPAKIKAIYAPELKGNSNEFKISIKD